MPQGERPLGKREKVVVVLTIVLILTALYLALVLGAGLK